MSMGQDAYVLIKDIEQHLDDAVFFLNSTPTYDAHIQDAITKIHEVMDWIEEFNNQY